MRPDTISGRLRETAERSPAGTAVVDGGRSLDYEQLLGAAGAVASSLVELGVRAGDRVGIHMSKSIEAVAALHGTMLAGAAYVPLDTKSPVARLVAAAANAATEVVICDPQNAPTARDVVDSVPTADMLVIDGSGARVAVDTELLVDPLGSPCDAPAVEVQGLDVAYILYTSGSTGIPKGVTITHANTLAFVDWAVDTLKIDRADRLSSHAPFHFDLSVFDLYAACTAGAAVVLVPPKVSKFPVSLAAFIAEHQLSVWYSVPTTLSLLVESGALAAADLTSLRLVLFAGEVFPSRQLAVLMEHHPSAAYWNLYGPTETNVCTAHQVLVPPEPDAPVPSIGHPVSGDTCVVVDSQMRPVTAGTQGELVVAGPTVARGYWGDPERTAERFVSDLMPGLPTPPLYRTGDLVVQLPSGDYRFEGRIDDQVKARGHRIELGEIEVALHRHADVVEAAVVARPDPLVSNRIEAHVTTRVPVSIRALKRHVGTLLPAYMVPDDVIYHDALPRTSNAKVDRRAMLEGG